MMDDDLRELEPHISDHPFQPGSWPDACGYVDEHGWTCGYTRAEHTHISAERNRLPPKVRMGWTWGGRGPQWRRRLAPGGGAGWLE
jgi:hypothetical protein